MFSPNHNYRRFLDREKARARMGARGHFFDPDERDRGEPVYTAEELEELDAEADAEDLLKERGRLP